MCDLVTFWLSLLLTKSPGKTRYPKGIRRRTGKKKFLSGKDNGHGAYLAPRLVIVGTDLSTYRSFSPISGGCALEGREASYWCATTWRQGAWCVRLHLLKTD